MKVFKNIVVMLVVIEISVALPIFTSFAFAFGWNIVAKIFFILSFIFDLIFAFIYTHIDEKEEDD